MFRSLHQGSLVNTVDFDLPIQKSEALGLAFLCSATFNDGLFSVRSTVDYFAGSHAANESCSMDTHTFPPELAEHFVACGFAGNCVVLPEPVHWLELHS